MFKNLREKIEERRFIGLHYRPSIRPQGDVTEDSELEYYVDKQTRQRATERVGNFEAKPARDDNLLKWLTGVFGFLLVSVSVSCAYLDELGATLQMNHVLLFAGVIVLFIVFGVIFWAAMSLHFKGMDSEWDKSIRGFFDPSAREAMVAIVHCMREFKRFVKWRRYMRYALYFLIPLSAVSILGGVKLYFADRVKWISDIEVMYFGGFLVVQLAWFYVYYRAMLYYTTWRDPTLQLCVMLNERDRVTVPIAVAAEPPRSRQIDQAMLVT